MRISDWSSDVCSSDLGWNQKWIFCEHRFVRGDRVCALVVVRYLFVSKRGPVPPSKVMALSGGEPQTPTLPDWVLRWSDTQDRITGILKAEYARSAKHTSKIPSLTRIASAHFCWTKKKC